MLYSCIFHRILGSRRFFLLIAKVFNKGAACERLYLYSAAREQLFQKNWYFAFEKLPTAALKYNSKSETKYAAIKFILQILFKVHQNLLLIFVFLFYEKLLSYFNFEWICILFQVFLLSAYESRSVLIYVFYFGLVWNVVVWLLVLKRD